MSYKQSIIKRTAKVSMVSLLSTILSMGMQFVSVPICLHYWGKDTYGTWLALMAAVILIRTVEGGYVFYVGNEINVLYHKNEQMLRVTLASAIWGVAFLGILQLLLLLALYYSSSMGLVFDSHSSTLTIHQVFVALIVLVASWVFTGSYIGILHRFLTPVGRMYDQAWWLMGYQVAQFIALITAAMSGMNILQAALLFALIQAIVYIASAFYIKVKIPQYYPWLNGAKIEVGLLNLIRSLPLTAGGMLLQGTSSAMIMLVSGILGAAAVPGFATIRTLSNLWNTLITIITTPLLPDIVRDYAKGDGHKLLGIVNAHLLLVGFTVNLSIIIMFPFLNKIFIIWTGNHLVFNKPLICLLLASLSLFGMSSLMNTLLSGINNFSYILTTNAIRGGISLMLGWILLHRYGIAGLGFAILISEICAFLVTLLMFFHPEIQKLGCKTKITFLNWVWLSPACVLMYLILESCNLDVINAFYWLTLLGIITGTVFSWRGLDNEIKTRFRNLFNTAR